MRAIRLQVEYLTKPLGLGNRKPRFYWNAEGGVTQTAYRIICTRDNETVWDSGKVTIAPTCTKEGVRRLSCTACNATKTEKIAKLKEANPLKIAGKTATVKYSTLKTKAQTLSVGKVIKFTKKGQGKLTYAKVSGNKKITINKKTGKVTVKKGIKKSFYTVTVDVSTKGNDSYSPATKSVTFYININ